ncbi:MAG: DUF4198 domain-containing protein [Pseudomonadota bacterium]|nr:DUF4198 domain-containing protein [Pseudomonadota bacterium]
MRTLVSLLALLLLPPMATAHDYWIESTLKPAGREQRLRSRLYLGDGLKVEEEQPYKPARASDFRLYLDDREIDLRPSAPAIRTPMLDMPFTGKAALLRLDRTPAFLDSDAAAFAHNLEHEEQLAAFPFALPKRAIRERYTRYLKSLVGSGARLHAHTTGQRLELILLDNPIASRVGSTIRVQARLDGKPMGRAALVAYRRDASGRITSQRIRTDASGETRFRLDGTGLWLVRMMHLRPCRRDCAEVQWESFWASYSFRR